MGGQASESRTWQSMNSGLSKSVTKTNSLHRESLRIRFSFYRLPQKDFHVIRPFEYSNVTRINHARLQRRPEQWQERSQGAVGGLWNSIP